MIPYGRQTVDEEDIAAVSEVLTGAWLTCGPAVDRFEEAIRAISGAPHVVAVSNGTAALRLLYQAVGIGPGSTVGVPAITFIATASQAMLLGAEVVVLDVDPETLLLTPETLDACEQSLDWVVPVHVAGRLCDMPAIAAMAARKGIRVLEDAAHAFGSTGHDGHAAGDCNWSDGAIFSFHPVKNITCGEGGAICVRDSELAASLRSLRHHGIVRQGYRGSLAQTDSDGPWYHEFHAPSSNERLSDLHAALGCSQCRKLQRFKQARTAIVERYREAMADMTGIDMAAPPIGQDPFWHLAVAHIDLDGLGIDRQQLFASARAAGIAPQVHYIPIHRQPILERSRAAEAGLPGADRAYPRLLSLPCFPGLTSEEQQQVIAWLRSMAQDVRR